MDRIEAEDKASNISKTYKTKHAEFMKRTKDLRSLVRDYKIKVKEKQLVIDEEVMKLMKSFNHDRRINKDNKE